MKCRRGFTLIEALIALGLACVLLAVAVPAMSHAVSAAHAGKARSLIATTLLDAMRNATVGGAEVVTCPSLDGLSCTGDPDWSVGWMSFADIDGSRQRGPHEPLIRREAALEGGVRLRSTRGRARLVFQPGGSTAGSNVTFTLCDKRGPRKAITLVMANTGHLRSGRPTAAAADQCAYQ
ncbi:GspH/FimT family protein [Lysobacter sp. A3-1-A15]|uniref:GspH/FimT family protein n=1 Tax=Novilysobacter viscosus TaxID=3098602 RepID=UPI002EDAC3AF